MPRRFPPSDVPGPRLTPESSEAQWRPAERVTPARRWTWPGLARDLAITFLGVFLALAANAWWQNREERLREVADLQQILAATRANEARLVQAIYDDSVTRSIANETRTRLVGGGTMRVDSLLTHLRNATWVSDWHPIIAPYAALAQTGDLRLIRDDKLRASIPEFHGELEATQGTLARIDAVAYDNVGTFYRIIPRDRIEALIAGGIAGGAEGQAIAGALSRNPDLRTLLRLEEFVVGNRVSLLKPLLALAASLRTSLEAELGVASESPPAPKPR